MRTVRRTHIVLGAALLAALGPAACGSSSDTATTGSASAKPSGGSVIKLSSAAPLTSPAFQVPEYAAGLTAALEAINAAGGVGGHQLSLDVCDTKFTVNGELSCARKMAAGKPAAVVAPLLLADGSGASWPILKAAALPAIGEQGGGPVELNSPNVFPLGSAFLGPFAGTAEAIKRSGATTVTIVSDEPNPAGPLIAKVISGALKARGIGKVKLTTARAASDPTFATAAAQAAAGGTDGIILNTSPLNGAGLIKALRAGGYRGQLAVPSLLLPPQALAALGAAADGVLVSSANALVADDGNPGVARFKADMAKYQPKAVVDDASIQAWSGMQLFAKAAATGKAFDAAGLTATFGAVKQPIDLQTFGPWAVAGRTGKVPGFARVVNPTVTFGVVRDGKVVAQGADGFVDPFAAGPPSS